MTARRPACSCARAACCCCCRWRRRWPAARPSRVAKSLPADFDPAGAAWAQTAAPASRTTFVSSSGSARDGSTGEAAAPAVGTEDGNVGGCSQVAMEQARFTAASMPAACRWLEASDDASQWRSNAGGCECDSSEASSALSGRSALLVCMLRGGWCTTLLGPQPRAPVAPRAGPPPPPLRLVLLELELASAACIHAEANPPWPLHLSETTRAQRWGGLFWSCHKDAICSAVDADNTTSNASGSVCTSRRTRGLVTAALLHQPVDQPPGPSPLGSSPTN